MAQQNTVVEGIIDVIRLAHSVDHGWYSARARFLQWGRSEVRSNVNIVLADEGWCIVPPHGGGYLSRPPKVRGSWKDDI